MRRRLLLAACLLAVAAPAQAQHPHDGGSHNEVVLRQAEVSPARLGVLPGEAVAWRNVSLRKHTVTSPAAGFDSGEVARGRTFTHVFGARGDYPYFCRIHPSVKGTIAVRDVLLEGPAAPVARGERFTLSGRAPMGELPLLRDGVAVATVASDGRFSTTVQADATAQWRVGGSDPVRVEVAERRTVSLVRRGKVVHVQVAPALPSGLVVLQQRRPERFGWWPLRRARLDESSAARFALPRRRAPIRVALTQADGATVLAVSSPLRRPRAR